MLIISSNEISPAYALEYPCLLTFIRLIIIELLCVNLLQTCVSSDNEAFLPFVLIKIPIADSPANRKLTTSSAQIQFLAFRLIKILLNFSFFLSFAFFFLNFFLFLARYLASNLIYKQKASLVATFTWMAQAHFSDSGVLFCFQRVYTFLTATSSWKSFFRHFALEFVFDLFLCFC